MGMLEDDLDEGVRRCVAAGHDSWTTHKDGSACTPACPIHPDYKKPRMFTSLMAANIARQHLWNGTNPDGTPVSNGPLYAALELGGEVGELLNVVKKLERERLGRAGSRVAPDAFADELGDVMICVYLLASEKGLDPMQCAAAKFNKTSKALGFPILMETDNAVS